MSVASTRQRFLSSHKPEPGAGLTPEELWQRHGASLLSMARVVLGDEAQALRAVTLGMVDLYRRGDPLPDEALRSVAHSVYRHCHRSSQEESIRWPTCDGPLCVYGGHTYRDAARVLGITEASVAELLTTGLRDLGRRTL